MANSKLKLNQNEVLCYSKTKKDAKTVKRHFKQWRLQQSPPIPIRCDEPNCVFNTKPLIWNDKKFEPILDHKNGVNSDNRPENLRFLCPNCDSQLETRGGGNKGRIEKSEGGFAFVSKEGEKSFVMPVEPGVLTLTGNTVNLEYNPIGFSKSPKNSE
jgi:hypothetical protein